jgi:hypothetical protein
VFFLVVLQILQYAPKGSLDQNSTKITFYHQKWLAYLSELVLRFCEIGEKIMGKKINKLC